MKKDNDKGFVVLSHSVVGEIDESNDILVKWVDGSPVNVSDTVFHRSYTDEKGVYHLDGVFEDIDQVQEYLYRLAGQLVQDMLRKGWQDIKVDEKRIGRTRDTREGIIVTVYGKTKDGKRGWRENLSIGKIRIKE